MLLEAATWGPDSGLGVVCLHGVTSSAGRFERLAQEWLADQRVVSLDLRGHGDSGWEPPWDIGQHVADIVETVTFPTWWVGHSFGGRLVSEIAAIRPDLVIGAVLLDPAMHVPPSVAFAQAEAVRGDRRFSSAAEYVGERFASGTIFLASREALADELAGDLVPADDGIGLVLRFCRSAAVTAWSEMAKPAPRFPSCPTLVVHGAQSWMPPQSTSLPNVETVVVPGGHSILWDALPETGQAIASFIERWA